MARLGAADAPGAGRVAQLNSGSATVGARIRARRRCEFGSAHEQKRAQEVDAIEPRNQGGSDDLSNLQALCFRGLQVSDALRGRDQKGKVAATSERRISRVWGSMGEGSQPIC